jgi:hypothetical protein
LIGGATEGRGNLGTVVWRESEPPALYIVSADPWYSYPVPVGLSRVTHGPTEAWVDRSSEKERASEWTGSCLSALIHGVARIGWL